MTKSKYLCPVCELFLSMEDILGGGIAVACANLKCPSYAASHLSEGKNEEDAHYKLQKAVEREIAQNDRHGALCSCECCMTYSVDDWAEMEARLW